jgi:hypothetical protein
MKQIPKWFVGLMTTLSTRLRETNERLQAVEAKQSTGVVGASSGTSRPLENIAKILGVLSLVWHKDGIKEGKNWQVARNKSEDEISNIIGIKKEIVHRTTEALIKGHLLTIQKDTYNNDLLTMANRGVLEKFSEFIAEFMQSNPDAKGFPQSGINFLTAMKAFVDKSAYETVMSSYADICKMGERLSMETTEWKSCLAIFSKSKSGITMAKASDGGVALKVQKVEFGRIMSHYAVLAEISTIL